MIVNEPYQHGLSLFSPDAVVVSVPEEDFYFFGYEDTLNKVVYSCVLAQKFAQFEAFPKLIITRMTSRNLLSDAVSALRFACLVQKLSSFGTGVLLFLAGTALPT